MKKSQRTIYTWEDGSSVEVLWNPSPQNEMTRHFFFVPRHGKEEAGSARFNPYALPKDRMFYLYMPDDWRAKVAGFFLDLGGSQDFASAPSPSVHISPYPIWMSDKDWEQRTSVLTEGRLVEPDPEESGYMMPVARLAESQILPGEWNIYIMAPNDWRFVTGQKKNYAMQVPSSTGTYGRPIVIRAKNARRLVDKICERFHILPESKREWWEKNQVERGTFVLPSPEEVEMFRLLDEELPFLWPPETFEPWIEAQE